MENESWMCVLCGDHFVGWGNNPEPVRPFDSGQCCDTCNSIVVLPARLALAAMCKPEPPTPIELTFDGGTWGVVVATSPESTTVTVLDEDGGEHELSEARID